MTQTASGVRCPASLWVCSFLHSHRYFPNLTRLFPRFLSFSPNQNISLQFTFYTDTRPAFQRVDSHSLACQGFIALAARETGLLQAWRPPSLAAPERWAFLVVPRSRHTLSLRSMLHLGSQVPSVCKAPVLLILQNVELLLQPLRCSSPRNPPRDSTTPS